MPDAGAMGNFRIGLADVIPTSAAEMDAAVELFPHAWDPRAGPNQISMYAKQYVVLGFNPRKGLVTGGKKLVVQLGVTVDIRMRVDTILVVSGLPIDMAGWLAHNKV